MWYFSKTIRIAASSYEEKIIRADAERIARRRLYYQGDPNPNLQKVAKIVELVISNLKDRFENLDKIRRASSSETLNSIIEEAVIEILP